MRELEEDRQRLRDEGSVAERRLHLVAQRIEPRLDPDGHELRRRAREPGGEIAHDVHLDAGDLGVADRLGVRLGDVQLIVDVGVRRACVRTERVQDLVGQLDLERGVQQHLARVGVGDEPSLVADDRAVYAELGRDAPRAPEHPPRREDDLDAGGLGGADRGDRARRGAEGHPVEDRPVEIGGDRPHRPRVEPGRQHRVVRTAVSAVDQPPPLPATAAT